MPVGFASIQEACFPLIAWLALPVVRLASNYLAHYVINSVTFPSSLDASPKAIFDLYPLGQSLLSFRWCYYDTLAPPQASDIYLSLPLLGRFYLEESL